MNDISKQKIKAIEMRGAGFSYREISEALDISLSTVHGWTSKIILNDKALARIELRKKIGREKSIEFFSNRRKQQYLLQTEEARLSLKELIGKKSVAKLACSLLFWAEGSKSGSFVSFINSDPTMIKLFLILLRLSFNINETKLRALVHMHDYHDESKIKEYWSKITDIPLSQFSKSYVKPHTGIRQKADYNGSIRIRYYDVKIAQELFAIYNTYSLLNRAVVQR